MNGASDERLQELLALRATEGLSGELASELDRLLGLLPEWNDDGFERAAAALDLALSGPDRPMPETVARLIREQARHPRSIGRW